MPNPKKHAGNKTWLERVGGWIPGFSGYLEKESRRECDALARKWLGDRLNAAKPAIDRHVKDLATSGRLNDINAYEQIRIRLDTLIGKFRSAPAGYSGFFDFVKVDEAILDRVYEHDMSLAKSVDSLGEAIENIGNDEHGLVGQIATQIDQIQQDFDERRKILEGISES